MDIRKVLTTMACVAGLAAGGLASVAQLSVSTASAAGGCTGNACASVTVSSSGACYLVTNRHPSRSVETGFDTGTGVTVSKELAPGESFKPAVWGQCITTYVGTFSANFR
jgi:hypothetical protein